MDTGEPFQPSDTHLEEFLSKLSTISDNAKTEIVKELTHEELTNIVKFCPNGKSATVIPPNVEGVPDVTELRPITLLCCDYRIIQEQETSFHSQLWYGQGFASYWSEAGFGLG